MSKDLARMLCLGGLLVVGVGGGCTKGGDTNETDTDTSGGGDDTDTTAQHETDCSDGKDNDGDNDVDCDDSDCADETACATPEYFTPYAFFVTGAFAYDADLDQVQAYILSDGTVQKPFIDITIAEEDYFTSNYDDRYACDVVLEANADTMPLTTWAFTDTYGDNNATIDLTHVGFQWDNTEYTVIADTCTADNGKEWDPDTWDGGAEAAVGNWGWGVGVGDYRPDIEQGITDAVDDPTPYFGGGLYWSLLNDSGAPPGYTAANFGEAYAMDADGNIQMDDSGNPITLIGTDVTDAIDNNGVPPTGVYVSSAFYGFYADYLAGT